jgi:hypothetical protein
MTVEREEPAIHIETEKEIIDIHTTVKNITTLTIDLP